MPAKLDQETTSGTKLLRMYQKLLFNAGRHYQGDLAEWLNCSRQTVSRLALEIEGVVGAHLQTGIENHRRWYSLKPGESRCNFGMDLAEIRYLQLCRDLAETFEPKEVCERMDETMFRFSMLLAEARRQDKKRLDRGPLVFFRKGYINYRPFFPIINTLLDCRDKGEACLVTYQSSGAKNLKSHCMVIGDVICMNGALYILGGEIAADGKTMRHPLNLAVHRIKAVERLGEDIPFCMLKHGSGFFGLPWHEPRKYSIHFKSGSAADYVRERIWADEQHIENLDDGSLILHITTCSEPELLAWMRGFGVAATLIEPRELDLRTENGE